jgi:hypothetical protein
MRIVIGTLAPRPFFALLASAICGVEAVITMKAATPKIAMMRGIGLII